MAYGPANAAKSQRRLVGSVIEMAGSVTVFCWLDSALTMVDDGHRHRHKQDEWASRREGKHDGWRRSCDPRLHQTGGPQARTCAKAAAWL